MIVEGSQTKKTKERRNETPQWKHRRKGEIVYKYEK